jgi:tRNA pseudouridine55 synthase
MISGMSEASADGILLFAKPAGVTSHDVVEDVRRSEVARGAKVGHAGTLDPFATGLLVVLVGRATRVQRYLMALPKSYRTVARFGFRSDSGDPTGELTATEAKVTDAQLRELLPRMTGEVAQRVPMTSAVKVGGERLYRKARRGEVVETPTRTVTVSRLELVAFDEPAQTAALELDCSSGTYVRQVVSDLGELCGAGAYCLELERLAVGPFRLEQADPGRLIPLSEALRFLPERALEPEEAARVAHGRAVEAGPLEPAGDEAAVRLTADGRLVAIAERRNGALRPVTVLYSR